MFPLPFLNLTSEDHKPYDRFSSLGMFGMHATLNRSRMEILGTSTPVLLNSMYNVSSLWDLNEIIEVPSLLFKKKVPSLEDDKISAANCCWYIGPFS